MSLRDLATDVSCAPDAGASSSTAPANPLGGLARAVLDAPVGLEQQTRGPRGPLYHPDRHLLLADHAPAHHQFPALPPPHHRLLAPQQFPGPEFLHPPPPSQDLQHALPPAGGGAGGGGSGGNGGFVEEFLSRQPRRRPGPPPPPLPSYFPRTYGRPISRVPAPGPSAATARFEAAFASAAPGRAYPHAAGLPARAGAAPLVPAAAAAAAATPGGTDGSQVLRERARVRARERFPGEGEAFVEAEVAEFMEMIAGEGGMPVVGDPAVDQGTEDWERQFAGLAIAGESIARSMAGRGEERMERSALRGFSEALAGLDGSGEWASGDVSALPVLGDADDEAVLVAGDGLEGESHPDAWTQQFVAGAGAGAVGATGLESAHGDTFNADLYEYLGRDPATVGYEFAPLDGNRYASLSAREALQEGIRLRNAGELSRAVQALETAAAAGKLDKEQSARAWYLLGTTHAECDDDERAIQAFLRCIGARNVGETAASASSAATVPPVDNPYRSGALLALGVCYTNELNTPKALSHIREWLDSREPGRGGALPVSDIWRSSPAPPADGVEREHRLLLARLERADREDPGDVDVSIAMGVLYNLSRQYELAARAMRMAVTLRPDDARLWNKLGATLANGNESDDALRAYRKAVDLSPSFIRAWVNVGTAYANRSDFDKAARYYLKALSMHADDQEQRSSASADGAGPSAAPPSGGGLAAYVGDSEMVHVWGYLRTTLVAMQREDLLPLVESGNTDAFKPYVLF